MTASYLYQIIERPITRKLLETLLGYQIDFDDDPDMDYLKKEAFYRLCYIGDRTGLLLKSIADMIDNRQMRTFAEFLPTHEVRLELLPKVAELLNLGMMPMAQIAIRFGVVTPALRTAMEKWRNEYAANLKRTKLNNQAIARRVKLATGMDWDPSMIPLAVDPILYEYAKLGGPFPKRNIRDPISRAFYSGFKSGPHNIGVQTADPSIAQAFLAGMKRKKIEPRLFSKKRKPKKEIEEHVEQEEVVGQGGGSDRREGQRSGELREDGGGDAGQSGDEDFLDG